MKFYNVFSGFLTGAGKEYYLKNIGDRKFNNLHSYWYLKNYTDDKIIEGFSLTKGNIMIDSGAFTAWSKDIEIDVDEYIKWINKWESYVTTFGQIDVIPPRGCTIQEKEECCKKTWENYLYMIERVTCPKKILYTFHYGEPFKWLEQALAFRDKEGKPIEYIAVGGLVGRSTKNRKEFLDEVFRIISESSNPNIKVHGFGVSSAKLWRTYPFESCDSFSAGMNTNHGFTYDENGSTYRTDDYKKLFTPEKKKIDSRDLLMTEEEKQEIELYNESLSETSDEISKRGEDKIKLLINNIEYWDKLANSIEKPKFKSRNLF